MRFPVSTAVLTEARMYALESLTHTIDYQGWKDAHFKAGRIMTGKFAQIWLAELCRLNGIPHERDRSSPLVADECDLKINGWVVDSKVTIKGVYDGQVSPNHDRKKDALDAYVFFRTDPFMSFIEPLGFVWSRQLESVATKVMQGEMIPGTSIPQRFGHSYFVDRCKMEPFVKTLEWMTEKRKPANVAGLVATASDDEFPF